jgi:hypothetical protein
MRLKTFLKKHKETAVTFKKKNGNLRIAVLNSKKHEIVERRGNIVAYDESMYKWVTFSPDRVIAIDVYGDEK